MTTDVTLDIAGMTCASCAQRIERKLNKLDGVTASVSYATEKAVVAFPDTVSADDLVATVVAAGYAATPLPVVPERPQPGTPAPDRYEVELAALRQRLVVSAVLTVPVVLMAMVPALQFEHWQWASLTLAAPVAVWGAWPFHRAAWANLRHGATTMDTLVSLGVLAAFGWSLVALFAGSAGDPGMRHPFSLTVERTDGLATIYLEVAAGVTTFLLAGRYLEKRAKRRAGEALRALLDLGARDVAVLRDGGEVRIPVDELAVGQEFVVRPGERVATDGVVVRGTSAIDASLLTGEAVPVEVEPGDEVTGATVNAGGRLVVRATRVGAETRLAQMARLVDAAQNGKADVQRLADRVSAVFVPVVIAIAAGCPRLLAGGGRRAGGGLHGRRGRADRGLPVRARPGDADRADGRHRPGRPARHPDPRPRGARGHPPHRHRRPRQDRHGHDRADDPGRRRRGARVGERRRTPAGRRRRVRLGAPGRPRGGGGVRGGGTRGRGVRGRGRLRGLRHRRGPTRRGRPPRRWPAGRAGAGGRRPPSRRAGPPSC